MKLGKFFLAANLTLASVSASAGSLYLPLKLSPEIEAHVERLMVLADMPIIKRPIAIAQVQEALDRVGNRDPQLVSAVSHYIDRYSHQSNLTHASFTTSRSTGADVILPNERGYSTDNSYQFSAAGYWVVNDFVALNLGANVWSSDSLKDEFLDGSFISFGWDELQVDVGWRPHWLSPFQENSVLVSTQAASLPGVTISNVEPFDYLGFSYELFLAQLSESDLIETRANARENATGNPKLFGLHLGFNPFKGFAIGFNRLVQFGGADRSESPSDLLDAFINPQANDNVGREGNDFGNQLTAVNTRYTFQDPIPFSVYLEYAGEDTSLTNVFSLGNTALSAGIHLPKLFEHFDFSYEFSDWQNGWYVNANYGDGLTNYDTVIGLWAATQRDLQFALPGNAHWAQLIWDGGESSTISVSYRQVEHDNNANTDFANAEYFEVQYSRAIGRRIGGITLRTGSDAWDENFTQISGFIRW